MNRTTSAGAGAARPSSKALAASILSGGFMLTLSSRWVGRQCASVPQVRAERTESVRSESCNSCAKKNSHHACPRHRRGFSRKAKQFACLRRLRELRSFASALVESLPVLTFAYIAGLTTLLHQYILMSCSSHRFHGFLERVRPSPAPLNIQITNPPSVSKFCERRIAHLVATGTPRT